MEPISLGLGAIAAAVFAKAQERAAEGAVEGGESAARRLAEWVRERLSRDETGTAALERVEREPGDETAVNALAEVVEEHAHSDDAARAELAELVEEAKRDPVAVSFVTQIYPGAIVGKQVNIGQARDVTL